MAADRVGTRRGDARGTDGEGGEERKRISGGINVKGTNNSTLAGYNTRKRRNVRAEGGKTNGEATMQPWPGRGKDADYGVSNNHADCIFCADSCCLPPRLLVQTATSDGLSFPVFASSFVVVTSCSSLFSLATN